MRPPDEEAEVMFRPGRMLWVALAALALASLACAVYNESCPVTTPVVVGTTNVDLVVKKSFVRSCEAPIGDFFADALIHHSYELKDSKGNDVNFLVAMFNAGAIRDSVVCGAATARDRIPKGPVTDQDLLQVMPFSSDTASAVELSGAQLREVLEHSIATIDADTPKGFFMQVSTSFDKSGQPAIEMDVDCSQPAQTLDANGMTIVNPGSRIQNLTISGVNVDTNSINIFHLITINFETLTDKQGVPNDGFVTFHKPGVIVTDTHIPVMDLIKDWLKNYGSVRTDLDYPKVEGRIQYHNLCSKIDCSAGGG